MSSRARDRFEEAILAGHTAALLDQERTSVLMKVIGNPPARVRPGRGSFLCAGIQLYLRAADA